MKKILIAEHSSVIAESLAEILRRKYIVFTRRGDCLSAALESIRPDVLIVDIALIGIDGLLKLRSTAYTPPVLFIVTNILTEQLLLAAQDVGADYIARFPFSLDTMARRLDDLLGK